MQIGDTVRNVTSGTLFEVVALPSRELPLLTVRFKAAPEKTCRVDPKLYVVVEDEPKRQKRGGLDRQKRGGFDRAS